MGYWGAGPIAASPVRRHVRCSPKTAPAFLTVRSLGSSDGEMATWASDPAIPAIKFGAVAAGGLGPGQMEN